MRSQEEVNFKYENLLFGLLEVECSELKEGGGVECESSTRVVRNEKKNKITV